MKFEEELHITSLNSTTNFVVVVVVVMHCQGLHGSEHTERTTMGAGDKSGGRGKEKVWNGDMRRSVEGRGMGWGTQGKEGKEELGGGGRRERRW